MTLRRKTPRDRKGTTTVEAALILPLFFLFLFGLFTIGHALMIHNLLDGASRSAGRFGANEGITTAMVEATLIDMLSSSMDTSQVNIIVKDGSSFDNGASLPATEEEYDNLPNINIEQAGHRQLFLVRATVRYNDIAILPVPLVGEIVLSGESLTRHE